MPSGGFSGAPPAGGASCRVSCFQEGCCCGDIRGGRIGAEGLAAGRARISDEEWVAMGGGLDDAEYNARFQRHFGIELR